MSWNFAGCYGSAPTLVEVLNWAIIILPNYSDVEDTVT